MKKYINLAFCCILLLFLSHLSCKKLVKQENTSRIFTYEVIDSIIINSTDEVIFMNYDRSNNNLLFLERAENNLLIYDVKEKYQKDLSYLKETLPLLNRNIIKAHLHGDVLFIINANGFFKYDLHRNKLLYSNNALMAQVIPGTEIIDYYKEGQYITNLIPYFGVPEDKHVYVAFGLVQEDGSSKVIYADKKSPALVDVRPHLIVDVESDFIANYYHPLNEVGIGNLHDIIENDSKFGYKNFSTPFLKDHPYHLNVKYSMDDLPNIPTTYSVFIAEERIIFHNWPKANDKLNLIFYDKSFNLLGKAELNHSLYQIKEQFSDGTFLFKLFGVEYEDYTVFKIVDLNI